MITWWFPHKELENQPLWVWQGGMVSEWLVLQQMQSRAKPCGARDRSLP